MSFTTKQVITFFILFLPCVVSAECYQESTTLAQSKASIREIADLRKTVTSTGENRQVCTVAFKVLINGKWHDARGESEGHIKDSTDQICSQAMQSGKVSILEKIDGINIRTKQTMYCNDFDNSQIRKGLKKYDTFRISELTPVPNSTQFEHKGAICREFLESDIDSNSNNLVQWHIVGCLIRDQWTIVDKY